jgi:hypothetical protein
MYTYYRYAPTPVRHETKWHFGWTSCLLFLANLFLLAVYSIVPEIPVRLALASITIVSALGILSATVSIVFGKFWLSKTYAACGLMGNTGVLLWILLLL